MIYKIVSITDKQGNQKLEPFEDCLKLHPSMEGEFLYFELMCKHILSNERVSCCFLWSDTTDKFMKTSTIEYIVGNLGDYNIKIGTRNSVYTFERVE